MADRISSLSDGYNTGMLSLFPEAIDDFDSLFKATNNAKIQLKQTLTFAANRIIVEDTSLFPNSGILRIGPENAKMTEYEMVFYTHKTRGTFEGIIRGFAGSKQGHWYANKCYVTNSVFAEHHNAIKDAILNMQANCGIKDFPEPASLNGILKYQEVRFLAPKPLFRAFPIKGPPELKVRFQNFTTGHITKYLWDFGDGSTSLEKSPNHTYVNEGVYTVKLNTITSTGAQGIATKVGYITVSADESIPFFYVDSINDPYSQETADKENLTAKEFLFVDQSDGNIVQRNWIFGDGVTYTEEDPDKHSITHIYEKPGEYNVSQLIQYSNGRIKRVELPETLVVF